MDLNKLKMNNNESVSLSVSPSLSLLVDKIFTDSNSSKQSAIFQFHKVIQNNIDNEKNISYILHCLSSQISSTQNSIERRKQLLTFLPSFFLPFAYNIDMAYPYVSRILTIIQNTISLSGITPEYMSSIFSDVVIAIFQNEIENENQVDSNKNNYELFQGFCIYNMKQSDEHLQQFGAMCLKVLTSTLNYYAKNDKYLKYIWEKVIVFIDNENFNDTIDLLHSIENLIVKSGGDKFKGYANITLYKILDYMTVGNEDEVRKEALNIILLLSKNCKNEIYSLKKQLIECLNVLKNDIDNDIKNTADDILEIINEDVEKITNVESEEKKKKKNNLIRSKNESIFNTRKNSKFFNNSTSKEEVVIVTSLKNQTDTENNNNEDNDIVMQATVPNENKMVSSLNLIMKQMKELSDKQLSLIDSIENIQKELHKTTAQLSERISKLEHIIIDSDPLRKMLNDKDTKSLLNFYMKTPLKELTEVHNDIIDSSINQIINEKENEIDINKVVNVLKKLIIGVNSISSMSSKTIENTVTYLNEKVKQKKGDEIEIEIKLILTYLSQINQ